MTDGILVNISLNPPPQLSVVADDGIGGGMMMSRISGTISVNVSSSTPYSFDSDDVDLSNLLFTPTFDNSTIALGQRIEVGSGGVQSPSINSMEHNCVVCLRSRTVVWWRYADSRSTMEVSTRWWPVGLCSRSSA